MIWVFLLIAIVYAILIFSLAFGIQKVPYFSIKEVTPKIEFSIIIPFRNEVANLSQLLDTISNLDYPKNLFEVIFIDDDSNDNSVKIIEKSIKFSSINATILTNIRTSNSPKKDAITTAISETKHSWIITTDADCLLPVNWLHLFNSFIIERQPKMIVAPVNYKTENSFLDQFQLLDFMSLQGATIGGFGNNIPFLCNGANLAYEKQEFYNVNGFEGNTSIASGDDIFLFEKFLHRKKNGVLYLKSKAAIVTTFPVKNWKALVQQRIRWAAKTGSVTLTRTKVIGFIIFLMNLVVIANLFLTSSIVLKIIPLAIKIIIDLLLFLPIMDFFNQKKWKKHYIFSSILYPFFSLAVIFLSFTSRYTWKGRRFKK